MRVLVDPVDPDTEPQLIVIEASMCRVMESSRVHAIEEVVGEITLCKVNTVEYGKKVEDPFYIDMKDRTN